MPWKGGHHGRNGQCCVESFSQAPDLWLCMPGWHNTAVQTKTSKGSDAHWTSWCAITPNCTHQKQTALTSTSKQSRSSNGSKISQCYTQELVQITFSSSITPKHKHLRESVAGRIQCMNSKQSGAWNKQLSLRQAQHRTRCGNNSNHVTRKKCTFWICKDSSPRSQANQLRASSHQNKKVSTWRSLIASLDWQLNEK